MRCAFRVIAAGSLLLLAAFDAVADAGTPITGRAAGIALQGAIRAFDQARYALALDRLADLQASPQRDYYRGLSELKLGNTERAVEYLQQVTEDQPGNADAFYALAAAHFRRLEEVGAFGKFAAFRRFRKCLETALALQPGHLGANLVYVLFLLEAPPLLGESKQQVDARIEAIANLNRAYAEYLWGYRAWKAGDPVAERHFKQAVALGALPRATYALARLYLEAGQFDRAIAWALELSEGEARWDEPGKLDAHWLAAKAHVAKGEVGQGERHFRQALALCPAGNACPGLRAELAAIRD